MSSRGSQTHCDKCHNPGHTTEECRLGKDENLHPRRRRRRRAGACNPEANKAEKRAEIRQQTNEAVQNAAAPATTTPPSGSSAPLARTVDMEVDSDDEIKILLDKVAEAMKALDQAVAEKKRKKDEMKRKAQK